MNSYEQCLEKAQEITRAYKERYWAAADAVNKGTPPPAPPPPDPSKVTTESARLLPLIKQIEAAARMGRKIEYADPQTGETRIADFTGVGDLDQALQQYMFQRETAPMAAQDLLDLLLPYYAEHNRHRGLEEQLQATYWVMLLPYVRAWQCRWQRKARRVTH
jgi:hypothetical protein